MRQLVRASRRLACRRETRERKLTQKQNLVDLICPVPLHLEHVRYRFVAVATLHVIVDFGPGDRVDRVAGVWLNERAGLVDEEELWKRVA